jgi:hypothetical protein
LGTVEYCVVLECEVGGILESYAHASGTKRAFDYIASGYGVLGIHKENAYGIKPIAVVSDDIFACIHKVKRVSTVLSFILLNGIAMRVPNHHISGLCEQVMFDDIVIAIPEPQSISAKSQVHIFRSYKIIFHDRVVDHLHIDTEEAVIYLASTDLILLSVRKLYGGI